MNAWFLLSKLYATPEMLQRNNGFFHKIIRFIHLFFASHHGAMIRGRPEIERLIRESNTAVRTRGSRCLIIDKKTELPHAFV
ncbi:hypothetical protein [Tepidiphilus margaritifer]|uniref:hypothetical protein n=1 Tax=Tepidiphilus margaritifer TaxID=203471 RepID=UPI0012FA80E2|nr:hypothetical protein [Tepidiphilus margaritifer]